MTTKAEQAAESTFARLFARFGTPILLMVGAWFLNGISAEQKAQGQSIAGIQSDVRDVKTRMEVQVLEQLKDLRRRVEAVEQAQKGDEVP